MLRKTFKLTSAASMIILAALVSCGSEKEINQTAELKPEVDSTSLAGTLKQLQQDDSVKAVLPAPTKEALMVYARGNTLQDISFDKDTIRFKAGSDAIITLVNEGLDMPMIHNLVITKKGMAKAVALAGAKIGSPGNYIPKDSAVIAASPLALPGQRVKLEFKVPDKKGQYDFVCTYPEHYQKMHGMMLVE
ncbi:plastocyanin/azurin family copper-binding protein [Pontibacter arcticus]|uniref:Blue (type 1) copper domain-containing protein n=1 Tax=Pontibacter arcticus TaxID=2080288 RepID=A0A364RG95_9BACT|nr:plastocyanin/azurin family copper-binding protein [Pontibacter arcticus]RAU83321.1 hypothetical protein DP923_08930 [Pontibacter arcticus]